MGIWERMPDRFLDALGTEFDFAPPRDHGLDTVGTIRAMRDGQVRVFFAMGGNFVAATPDTEATESAMRRCRLTVHVSTKLNRSHVVTGARALILPTLGRTDIDIPGAAAAASTHRGKSGAATSGHGLTDAGGRPAGTNQAATTAPGHRRQPGADELAGRGPSDRGLSEGANPEGAPDRTSDPFAGSLGGRSDADTHARHGYSDRGLSGSADSTGAPDLTASDPLAGDLGQSGTVAPGGAVTRAGSDRTAATAPSGHRLPAGAAANRPAVPGHLLGDPSPSGLSRRDRSSATAQFVTVEDSMGIVHSSRGSVPPLSPHMRSEVAIVTGLARAVFGPADPVPWEDFAADYDRIRDRIERVVPGFADFNARARVPAGFSLPHAPRDARVFPTVTGKANFTINPVTSPEAGPGRLLLQTLRSHDQFNTTIYGLDDRYRGIHDGRRVVLVNPEDAAELDLRDGAYCDLVSEWSDGDRRAAHFRIVHYPTARGCAAAYFPETNVLVPLDSVAEFSNTPTSKSIVIRFEPDSDPVEAAPA